MMKRRSAFALVAALASPSWGWGPVGHKAIAMIAQSRLTPGTSQAIGAILGPGASLEMIANCPDQFVYQPDRVCAGIFTMLGDPKPTKPWHYLNAPVTASLDAGSIMSYCPQDDCSVAQVRKDIEVLKEPSASLQDRRMALMFLVHFVGDEHQPLHSATGVPDDYGGNEKPMRAITYRGRPLSLHAVWDEVIEDPAEADYRLPDETLTAQADKLAGSLEDGIQDAASWTSGDFISAAAIEGHDIARTIIYPEYASSGGNDALADYQAKMQPIAYKRLQMAGVRLAAILEQVFAGPQKSL